jgi:ribokinase
MIVVFGSINLDLIFGLPKLPQAGETVLGPSYAVAAGGKGANQAVAAARDGAKAALVGRVGRDAFAGEALKVARTTALDLTHVAPCDQPTGCAAVCVDGAGNNLIAVASGANARVTADQVPDAWLTPATTLVMQMEVPAAEIAALIERAKARGARVVLNLAPALPLPHAAIAAVDVLILNEIEAAAIAQSRGLGGGTPAALARSLAASAGNTVVITLGGEGAVAATPAQGWSIGSLPIAPVDTTGAGDAFVGVFAAALDRGAALPDALRRASVAAGLSCLTPGAQPSLPATPAIEARLSDVPSAVALI